MKRNRDRDTETPLRPPHQTFRKCYARRLLTGSWSAIFGCGRPPTGFDSLTTPSFSVCKSWGCTDSSGPIGSVSTSSTSPSVFHLGNDMNCDTSKCSRLQEHTLHTEQRIAGFIELLTGITRVCSDTPFCPGCPGCERNIEGLLLPRSSAWLSLRTVLCQDDYSNIISPLIPQ